ncbi:MAG: hypothetical protein HYX61_12390 [Gammaproteobacteria bacterium]|jgi:hypothetical protein|nr:hypothetical protein [Gammaproteobacteria bacterium]
MTAILFSIDLMTFKPKYFLNGKDSLEKLIMHEENNLKIMHGEFFGAITLHRLQFKLINALKHLLALIAKPQTTLQELMHQLSKISALYLEINGELSKAKRHKDAISHEIEAQEKRLQEELLNKNIAYYEDKAEARHDRAQRARKEAIAQNPEFELALDVNMRVKALLNNICQRLGLTLLPSLQGFKLAPHPGLPLNQNIQFIEKLLNEFNQSKINSTALEASLKRFHPKIRPY